MTMDSKGEFFIKVDLVDSSTLFQLVCCVGFYLYNQHYGNIHLKASRCLLIFNLHDNSESTWGNSSLEGKLLNDPAKFSKKNLLNNP